MIPSVNHTLVPQLVGYATATRPGLPTSTQPSPALTAANRIAIASSSHPTVLRGRRSAISTPTAAKAANPSAPSESALAPCTTTSSTASPVIATYAASALHAATLDRVLLTLIACDSLRTGGTAARAAASSLPVWESLRRRRSGRRALDELRRGAQHL